MDAHYALRPMGLFILVDCDVGEWGDWTDCSATCGGGTKSRDRSRPFFLPIFILSFFRTKIADAENGGEECEDYLLRILYLNDTDSCNTWPCEGGI